MAILILSNCVSSIPFLKRLFKPAKAESAIDRALQDRKQQEDRDGCEDSDHHLLGRRIAIVLAELDETEREGAQAIDRHYGERPQVLVPAVAKREDRKHRKRGPALRYDDLQQNAQFAGAVDPRCLDVIFRYRNHRLTHQKNAEGVDQQWRHYTLIRVHPLEL